MSKKSSKEQKKPAAAKAKAKPADELSEDQLERVAGGRPQIADGSLDAGIHFKYDGSKEG